LANFFFQKTTAGDKMVTMKNKHWSMVLIN
jgi:hypothetical protein